jgi:acyl dehydratase
MSEADIGSAGLAFEWVVERGKIREFARACLDDNPAYQTADAVAPPTFPQTAGSFWEPPGSRTGLTRPFELARLLHGEQEFEYVRPLRAGDVLTGQTRLKDYYEKPGRRGGTMRFAVYETTFTDRSGEPVAYSRATLIETAKPTTTEA